MSWFSTRAARWKRRTFCRCSRIREKQLHAGPAVGIAGQCDGRPPARPSPTILKDGSEIAGASRIMSVRSRSPKYRPGLSFGRRPVLQGQNCPRREGRELHGREGQDPCDRRRERLREIHARAHPHADRPGRRPATPHRGQKGRHRQGTTSRRNCAAKCRSCSRIPMVRSIRARRSAMCSARPLVIQHQRVGCRAPRSRHGDAEEGRPRRRALQPLSAHVLRRPAPAHRDCPGADAQSEPARARRAGVGARPFGPGAGAEPAGRSAGRVQPHLCLHQPRPVGGALHRRRRDGDVFRRSGRIWHPRRGVLRPASTAIPRRCSRRRRVRTLRASRRGWRGRRPPKKPHAGSGSRLAVVACSTFCELAGSGNFSSPLATFRHCTTASLSDDT